MEEKKEEVIINNSNEQLVTGVLYGLMNAIEILQSDELRDFKEGNMFAELINETITGSAAKIYDVFKLIREKKKVPDLHSMINEWRNLPARKEIMKDRIESIDKMWEKLNENK